MKWFIRPGVVVLCWLIGLLFLPTTGHAEERFIDQKMKIVGENTGSQLNLYFSYENLSAGFTGVQMDIDTSGFSRGTFTLSSNSAIRSSDIKVNGQVGGLYRVIIGGDRLIKTPGETSGQIGKLTFALDTPGDANLFMKSIIINQRDVLQIEALKVTNLRMTFKSPVSVAAPIIEAEKGAMDKERLPFEAEAALGQKDNVKVTPVVADLKGSDWSTELAGALQTAVKYPAGQRVVQIPLESAAGSAQVDLPFDVLSLSAAAPANVVLAITADGITYHLPLREIQSLDLESVLNAKAKDISVRVQIDKLSGEQAKPILSQAAKMGLSLVGQPVDFKVTASTGGKQREIDRFNHYVERSMVLDQAVNPDQTTVLLFDEATGEISFVPAVFTSSGGKNTVTIKRNGNSIYFVAKATRSFKDLEAHWAKAKIHVLASKRVLNGMTATAFAPGKPVTRSQFAVMLVNALGLKADTKSTIIPFTDVKPADWFAAAVTAAGQEGIVTGYSGGTFKPNDPITREQMAVMTAKAMKAAGFTAAGRVSSLIMFKDHEAISGWAQESVAGMVRAGVISGMTDGTFAPSGKATRAQAATMIYTALKALHFIN